MSSQVYFTLLPIRMFSWINFFDSVTDGKFSFSRFQVVEPRHFRIPTLHELRDLVRLDLAPLLPRTSRSFPIPRAKWPHPANCPNSTVFGGTTTNTISWACLKTSWTRKLSWMLPWLATDSSWRPTKWSCRPVRLISNPCCTTLQTGIPSCSFGTCDMLRWRLFWSSCTVERCLSIKKTCRPCSRWPRV